MRIGMMADMYKPHVSGITNYISLNKTFLEELGHQVFVFTFGDEGNKEEEERVDSLTWSGIIGYRVVYQLTL